MLLKEGNREELMVHHAGEVQGDDPASEGTREQNSPNIKKKPQIEKCLMLPSFAIANGPRHCQAAGVCQARLKGNVQSTV